MCTWIFDVFGRLTVSQSARPYTSSLEAFSEVNVAFEAANVFASAASNRPSSLAPTGG